MFLKIRISWFVSFRNFYLIESFWSEHFLGRNSLMKFKNACKQLKIIKKWLVENNLRSNIRRSNLPISAVCFGPKWAFKVLQTLTSAHHFSEQTPHRYYLRPKLSGPKSVERKNTKLWNLSKFLLKKTFLKSSEMSSADSKLTWKHLKTIKIDSADHLKTFIPAENFSIGAIFGPKTTCEVEGLCKMIEIVEISNKSQVFWW